MTRRALGSGVDTGQGCWKATAAEQVVFPVWPLARPCSGIRIGAVDTELPMGLALRSIKALDSGRHGQSCRAPMPSQDEIRVCPYWDSAICAEDEDGNLNVAGAAAIAVGAWCLSGRKELRQGLIAQLGQQAIPQIDAARRSYLTGDAIQHQGDVWGLRNLVEGRLMQQVRAGKLPVLKD